MLRREGHKPPSGPADGLGQGPGGRMRVSRRVGASGLPSGVMMTGDRGAQSGPWFYKLVSHRPARLEGSGQGGPGPGLLQGPPLRTPRPENLPFLLGTKPFPIVFAFDLNCLKKLIRHMFTMSFIQLSPECFLTI